MSRSGGDDLARIVGEIEAEAARVREQLPRDFEQSLVDRFAALAADPAALEREAAEAAPPARAPRGGAGGRADRAVRLARRAAHGARRVAGPRLRTAERVSVERAGRIAEALATQGEVVADRLRLLGEGGSAVWVRVSPSGRTVAPPLGRPAAPEADDDTVAWLLDRLEGAPGPVAHVESGDGWLLQRLAPSHQVIGVDPRAGATTGDGVVERAAGLAWLGRRRRASLGGLVLSGLTDHLRPGAARALCQLVASRLAPGGVVVVLSSAPGSFVLDDPVAADLQEGRPFHPVTWCHLFARYGLEAITVRHSGGGETGEDVPPSGIAYAVAARRPSSLRRVR